MTFSFWVDSYIADRFLSFSWTPRSSHLKGQSLRLWRWRFRIRACSKHDFIFKI